MAEQKLPPGAEYEQATPWLTDVHPDDVRASGEGFNAWLIDVTHGYVNVERLATVASAIPILNNLMALADVLSDIVSIVPPDFDEIRNSVRSRSTASSTSLIAAGSVESST